MSLGPETSQADEVDVVVIGGGFFGCEIAIALRQLGFDRIVVVEREKGIFRRASFVNQARVHNGYHYPRALTTAQRSRDNFERFLNDFSYAIDNTFIMVYAIAYGSKVNPTQFERFCTAIGAPCMQAPEHVQRKFDSDLIEAVFQVREFAFDASQMAECMIRRLSSAGVDLRLETHARLSSFSDAHVEVDTNVGRIRSRFLVNTSYAGLDSVGITLAARLKREAAEVVLVRPPPEIVGLGVTVMDGPYFSTMPFPAARLYSLTHVRYTPHEASAGCPSSIPLPERSNCVKMVRDSARYLPCMASAEVVTSLFEVKTVLSNSERDDGRPILLEVCPDSPRIISILGSKLDNIYDAIDAVRSYRWQS